LIAKIGLCPVFPHSRLRGPFARCRYEFPGHDN
jgi:hypothetical protein